MDDGVDMVGLAGGGNLELFLGGFGCTLSGSFSLVHGPTTLVILLDECTEGNSGGLGLSLVHGMF